MGLNIKPMGTRVIIEPLAAETKTASGIIIPDSAKEKPQNGKVLAIGKGTKDETMEVKVGDTVLYGKFAGTEINYDNKDLIILNQDEILAIL